MRLFLVFLVFLTGLSEARPRKIRKKRKKVRPVLFRPVTTGIEQAENPGMQLFFERLLELKNSERKEAMLILGDSHQQCEDFGQALLEYLRDSAGIPTAGRNFAFPYPLARTGHRSDIQYACNKKEWKGCRITNSSASCAWGICGWLASSPTDTVRFSLRCKTGGLVAGDEIGVFSPLAGASSYRLFLNDSRENREIPYVDSMSAYFTRLECSPEVVSFKAVRMDSSGSFVHQGFLRRPQSAGLSLGISGTNGARLDHYLQGPEFGNQLRILKPGLILIALGTNDAFTADFSPEKTRDNLGMLLSRIRMAVPDASVLLIGPPDHCHKRSLSNPNTEKVNSVYSEMAESLELGFWNQQSAMGGPGSIHAWRKKGLATSDFVHFYPAGYALQAKLLGRSILQHLKAAIRQPLKPGAVK